MKNILMKIEELVRDESIYPREEVDALLVYQYAESMKAGVKFPPITIANINSKSVVIDGFHRLKAYEKNGEKYVDCEIIPIKTLKEAFIESVKRNATHGKQFKIYEKKQIAIKLSDMEIESVEISNILSVPKGQIESFCIDRGDMKNVLSREGGEQRRLKMDVRLQNKRLNVVIKMLKYRNIDITDNAIRNKIILLNEEIQCLMKEENIYEKNKG